MIKKISTRQMMFSISAYIIGSSLLTKHLYDFAKQDAWLSVIFGFFFSMLIFWIYEVLIKAFPGMSIIEINDSVFGRILGKFISLLYILFFLLLASLNIRDVGDFVKGMLLPNTPMVFIVIPFIILCSCAVRKGAFNITGYGPFIAIAVIAAIFFNTVLLFNKAKAENFFPMLTLPLKNYITSSHMVAVIQFCEVLPFIMLAPYLKAPSDCGKALKGGLIIGAFVMLIITARDISVQGLFLLESTIPTFSVIRLIDLAEIFTRLEIIYAVILITLLFFKVNILFFAAVTGINRLMNFNSYKFLICIFGTLIMIYSMSLFPTNIELGQFGLSGTAEILASFFEILIPVATLMVAALRGLLKKSIGKTTAYE